MTRYQSGYRFERRVMEYLQKRGYYVIRSAGSHGVFDLVAIWNYDVRGIQCKKDGRISREEKDQMIEAGKKYGIMPVLAYSKGKKIQFELLSA